MDVHTPKTQRGHDSRRKTWSYVVLIILLNPLLGRVVGLVHHAPEDDTPVGSLEAEVQVRAEGVVRLERDVAFGARGDQLGVEALIEDHGTVRAQLHSLGTRVHRRRAPAEIRVRGVNRAFPNAFTAHDV